MTTAKAKREEEDVVDDVVGIVSKSKSSSSDDVPYKSTENNNITSSSSAAAAASTSSSSPTWKCKKCGRLNAKHKLKCISPCNAWNKTKKTTVLVSSAISTTVPPPPPPSTGYNYNTRKANNDVLAWKCPKCCHSNDLGRLICATKKCGAWKGKIERCELVSVPNTLALSVSTGEQATNEISKPTTTAAAADVVYEKKKVAAASKSNLSSNMNSSHIKNKKEIAWKCPKCSRHNALSHLRCATNNCCVWKGGSKSSTMTSTQGCDLVLGVGVEKDECVVCGYGGGEYVYVTL